MNEGSLELLQTLCWNVVRLLVNAVLLRGPGSDGSAKRAAFGRVLAAAKVLAAAEDNNFVYLKASSVVAARKWVENLEKLSPSASGLGNGYGK